MIIPVYTIGMASGSVVSFMKLFERKFYRTRLLV